MLACVPLLGCPAVALAQLDQLIPRVKQSVVAVGTYEKTRNPRFLFRGTGFAVAEGNLIATNAHVLPDTMDSRGMEVIAIAVPGAGDAEPQVREGRTVAVDAEHDLALIRISGSPVPPMTIARADMAVEGASTAFTGFPIGSALGLTPVTHRATISAITPIAVPPANSSQLDQRLVRRLHEGSYRVLQLDGTAYPGSSGSPLYELSNGAVLGIVNMVYVKGLKESVLSQPSGITFAMPAEYLRPLIARVNLPAKP